MRFNFSQGITEHGRSALVYNICACLNLKVPQAQVCPTQGQVESLLALAQGFLGLLAFSNIPEDTLCADNLAVDIINWRLDQPHVNTLPVGEPILFDGFKYSAGFDNSLVILLELLSQFGRVEVKIAFADQLIKAYGQTLAKAAVAKNKTSLPVFAEDILRDIVYQGLVKSL